MNKLEKAFDGHKAFIGFLTAGDQSLEDTERYIEIMAKSGCDLIEIGIPFSDPVAEGEVIQKATIRALAAGTTTDKIFDMVERVALKIDIPLVFMTYLNPVYVYGAEKFFARCEKAGISGIIVPDMPYEEKGELAEPARAHGVKIISLIAPTSEGRVGMIARDAEGFIYLVSSMGGHRRQERNHDERQSHHRYDQEVHGRSRRRWLRHCNARSGGRHGGSF